MSISLDSDHLSLAAHCPCHETRKLTKSAAKIQDFLSQLEIKLSQARLIQDIIK